MVVKRITKFEMPKLKRCIVAENDEKFSPKRLRTDELSAVPINEFEDCSTCLADSGCRGVSSNDGEAESNMGIPDPIQPLRGVKKGLQVHNAPLLKSSRGRLQVLPSKFNDSVLHSWKKERTGTDESELCFSNGDSACNKKTSERKVSCSDLQLYKKQSLDSRISFDNLHSTKSIDNLAKAEEAEFGYTGQVDCDSILYSSSKSSLTSISGGGVSSFIEFQPKVKSGFVRSEKYTKGKAEKKDYYEPGNFVMRDIVWAKCGKKCPAWPAIVIDPLWQAPESVLRACVADAICVMFYGYSRN